jgi:hypothetical protein
MEAPVEAETTEVEAGVKVMPGSLEEHLVAQVQLDLFGGRVERTRNMYRIFKE